MSTGVGPADSAGVVTADGSASACSAAPADGPESTVEVVVGRVAKSHGLRGDVLVDVRTDEPARRFRVGARLRTPRGDLTVAFTARHGTRLLARFEGVSDKDAADALRGLELSLDVPTWERPDDPEEYYDRQLIGLSVFDASGFAVGEIAEVMHLPTQDVLSVRRELADGQVAETLVPFVHELVPTVNLAAGRVVLGRTVESLSPTSPTADRAPDVSARDQRQHR